LVVLSLPWLRGAVQEGGDPGAVESDARRSDARRSDALRAGARYEAVEHELRARDVAHLDEHQRAARAALIEAFRAYRARAEFTRNTDFPGARVPYFVDGGGRLCAVANLLHASGEDELVQAVARANNHVWVSELAGDGRFEDWLGRMGLGFEEAVRTLAPGAGGVGGGGVEPGPFLGGSPEPAPGTQPLSGRPDAPADRGPARPSSGVSGPAGLPTPGVSPVTPLAASEFGTDDWLEWWELNKLRWLEPGLRARSALESDGRTRAEDEAGLLRRAHAPRIRSELAHAQADVRAAAAFAYARAAGGAAVAELLALFDDPSQGVREAAILALGVTDSEAGVHALLTLLRAPRAPTPRARSLAVVALGTARMHGRGEGTDAVLSHLLDALEREDGDDLLHAVLLFQTLAPTSALEARVRCASGRFSEDCAHEKARAQTRERALEALRFDSESRAVLPRLLDAVHGRDLAQRRSAAGVLAELPGTLEPLLTAYELEAEPLTRARLLLSIGEQGGERARTFLVRRLENGRRTERCWTALALGILGGDDWDARARAILREALGGANKNERDAFLLALGLARDGEAHELLVRTLATAKADRTRMFAALALGLIGAEEGHAVLRAVIPVTSCPYARSGMALALALYGDPADLPELMELLRNERRPESLRDLALALGMQRTPGTAEALLALLEEETPVAVRCATLDALGLALADDPSLAQTALVRASNYAAWPDWVRDLFERPL
jgi:HEAT repeat protein